MFDMSWGEVMVIGAVALIVIGPKDLPKALRTVGQVTGKVRKLAGEFQSQFNDAMREADLEDAKRQVEGINRQVSSLNTSFNPVQTIRDELKGAVDGKAAALASGTGAPPSEPILPAVPDAVPMIDLPPALQPADAASPLPRESEPAAAPVEVPGEPAIDPASPQPREKAGHAAP
jgi:sec-independent protein translocase protein TatB